MKRELETTTITTTTMNPETNNNKTPKLELRCEKCGQTNFVSRNKLFQHVKLCVLDRNPSKLTLISDEEYLKSYSAYIYVTGGRHRGKTLITAERFNLTTQSWEFIPNMCENRGSHGSAAVGKYLYVLGGGGLHSNLSSIERFDLETNTWTCLATMPSFRHALAVLSIDTAIYAIGGWINGSVCAGENERYNTTNDTWEILAPLPTPRRLLSLAAYGNKIYAFGGVIDDKIWNTNVLEIYDIASNTWSQGKALPLVGQTSAVTIGDYIYVIIHGHYILRYDPRQDTYLQLTTDLPCKQWFCFDVTVINNRMYFHGGNIDGVWSNQLWRYDPFENTWNQLPSMLRERRRCSAAIVIKENIL